MLLLLKEREKDRAKITHVSLWTSNCGEIDIAYVPILISLLFLLNNLSLDTCTYCFLTIAHNKIKFNNTQVCCFVK